MARLKGFKAVLAIFIFTLSFNSLVFANSEDLPETTWGEIKQWQPLGLRWAIGKDMAGNALAIYDLSYPGLGLPISMGAVGGKSLGTKQMVKLLMLAKDVEDADEDDLDDAANDLKQVQDEDYGNRLFPENWWKETPWKLLGRQSEQNEPMSFRLSDIEFTLASKKPDRMAEAVQEVRSLWADLNKDDQAMTGEFLEQIEFVRVSAGQYEMNWSPALNQELSYVSRPKKISDIRCPKCSFLADLKWKLFKDAVGRMINLVRLPVVNALLKTASDRFFHFQKLQVRTHENMVLEMLNDLREPDGVFPKEALTTNEQFRAVESISYAQSSIDGAYKWIWKKPYEEWEKLLKKGADFTKKSEDWFVNHELPFSILNSRFAVTKAQGAEKLHLMSMAKPNKKSGPQVAVDVVNSKQIAHYRMTVEILTPAVIFAANFINLPLVGSALEWLWGKFVENPIDKAKIYEGKLTAQLEQRSLLNNDWSTELAILDSQRINPMMRSRASMLELIEKRKKELGM